MKQSLSLVGDAAWALCPKGAGDHCDLVLWAAVNKLTSKTNINGERCLSLVASHTSHSGILAPKEQGTSDSGARMRNHGAGDSRVLPPAPLSSLYKPDRNTTFHPGDGNGAHGSDCHPVQWDMVPLASTQHQHFAPAEPPAWLSADEQAS